ncbi:MAG: tetratricopeptide repeat protein [Candidatus Omnitrophica bacterium]|nr:tetratricopeptide repeat protein [Candidatus Omnitrophota bacterium]
MRQLLVLMVCAVFLAGCGGDQQAKQSPSKPSGGQGKSQEFLTAGIQYLNQQDVARAIHSFDMAIKTDPTNVENYLVLGQVYMRLKQYERAIDTFSAATRVDPNHAEAYYLLSLSKMMDGRYEKAEEAAQRSVELFMLNREEDKFKRSLALLKTIGEAKQKNAAQAQ